MTTDTHRLRQLADIPAVSWMCWSNPLILHGRFLLELEENPREINASYLTLNQRVQGSSPCAPTSLRSLRDLRLGKPARIFWAKRAKAAAP
jgi:hypothetical protein